MLVEKIDSLKQKRIKVTPCNANRASELGHPCVRYHVLSRTRWEEKAHHELRLQYVFDLGNEFESFVLRELAEAGVKVIEQQRYFTWPEYQITGHVDGIVIDDDHKAYPLEIKSCSPHVFKAINGVDGLKRGRYLYLRKYPVQLNLYLLMSAIERGVFLFVDKVSGAMKEIWMDIDYELGERTLKRAEEINRHVSEGTLPDAMPYEDDVCGGCPFGHICLPERIGTEVSVIDDDELAEKLDRLEELKPMVREYEELDSEVKAATEGREKIIVGKWLITGKWVSKAAYQIPDEIKSQYRMESKYWRRSISRIER